MNIKFEDFLNESKRNFKRGTKFRVIGNHNSSPFSKFKLNHGGYNNVTIVPIGEIITLIEDDPHYAPKPRFEYKDKIGTVQSSIESMLDRKVLEELDFGYLYNSKPGYAVKPETKLQNDRLRQAGFEPITYDEIESEDIKIISYENLKRWIKSL